MPDLEKVIKALEQAKAQSDEYAQDRIIVPFKELDMILALLRDQEPLKPFYCEADDSWGCGNCGETVGYSEFNPGGIDSVRNKYCPECGRKVKWDG